MEAFSGAFEAYRGSIPVEHRTQEFSIKYKLSFLLLDLQNETTPRLHYLLLIDSRLFWSVLNGDFVQCRNPSIF